MSSDKTAVILCVLVLGTACSAARLNWTGAGSDNLWDNPANWDGGRVPTAGDEAYIDVPGAAPPGGPVIRDGIDAKALGLACEVAGEPNMAMTGGTLEVTDWIWWGDGEASHGTFHMSGGTITTGGEFELGWGGGEGTWIMTGGTVIVPELIIPTGSGRAGQLYLHGGTFNVGSGGLSMTPTGLIDITEGTLLLEGDVTGQIDGFIATGQITAYDGVGYFDIDHDLRNPGMTTVTAGPLTGKAYKPEPPDGTENLMIPLLQWQAGLGAVFHEVHVGTSPDALEFMGRQPMTMYYSVAGFTPGTRYYWRIDEIEGDGVTTHTGDVWTFTTAPKTAYDPSPWDGARWVDPDADLSWSAGVNALSHDVYFGTDRAAVEAGEQSAFKGNQMTTTYDPGTLADDTVYYWRIDERGAGEVVHEGAVWSFTTLAPGGGVRAQYFRGKDLVGAPLLTQVEGAIDHQWGQGEVVAGLSDQVSARWTANLEAPLTGTYTLITTSDDGVRLWLDGRMIIDNWTNHGTTDNRARVDLIAGQVYSVRMEYYEDGGGAVAQLSWQSEQIARQIIPIGPLQLPVRAAGPQPPNTAVDTAHTLVLRWIAGEDAAHHDVYLGDDADAVAGADTTTAGIYRGRQAGEAVSFDPGPLEWNKTYYWRVDEVNAASADSPWTGVVWRFTTANFIVIDDFEGYTDDMDAGEAIFQTWIDGVENGTGSYVGYEVAANGTFSETSIVHGGGQSMPLDYNNVRSPYYSQAERTWATPQDWTLNGVDTLTLYIRGRAANTPAALYIVIEDSAGRTGTAVHPDPAILTSAEWVQWQVPLSEFAAAGVSVNAVKQMIIGVGDPGNPQPDGTGLLYVDDIGVIQATSAAE